MSEFLKKLMADERFTAITESGKTYKGGKELSERVKVGNARTVAEQIEDVCAEICRNYCKYPDTWDEEKEGVELCESEICNNCPLNRL